MDLLKSDFSCSFGGSAVTCFPGPGFKYDIWGDVFFDPVDFLPQICEKRWAIFGTPEPMEDGVALRMCDPLQSPKTTPPGRYKTL